MVEVRDRNKALVKKILLTEWNSKRAYYEGLYGELPPPPPPPPVPEPVTVQGMPASPAAPGLVAVTVPGVPAPPVPETITVQGMPGRPAAPGQVAVTVPDAPAPPVAVKLPAHVISISIQNQKATVHLRNGKIEEYDLSVPEQKKEFNRKYGQEPTVPQPPLTVTGVQVARSSNSPGAVEEVKVAGEKFQMISDKDHTSPGPLYILDGKKVTAAEVNKIPPSSIHTMHVLKGKEAESKYGEDGKHGVILIVTRPAAVKEVVVTGYQQKKTQ